VDDAVGAAVRGEPLADPAGVAMSPSSRCRRPPGRILLEASVLPAAARATAADEPQVTEFGRAAVRADDEGAVGDDGAADARAEGHHHHVGGAAPAPKRYSPARGVRVVLERHRTPDAFLELRAQRTSCQSMLGACIMTERVRSM
jgi:hypothetical protein